MIKRDGEYNDEFKTHVSNELSKINNNGKARPLTCDEVTNQIKKMKNRKPRDGIELLRST